MRKRIISRITAVISLLLCLLAVFNSVAVAADSSSEALSVDEIKISQQCGVLEGKSVQLTATLSPENALMSSVEWSSSNPKVISCTSDGIITGVSAGGYADITCKAKWGKASDKIRIYCVEPADEYVKSNFVGLITPIFAQPAFGKTVTMHFNTTFFVQYMMGILAVYFKYINYAPLGVRSSADLAGGKCEIRGKYNSYAYIIVETESGYCDGFVKYTKLEAQTNLFLSLSAEDIDVWGNGYVNTNKKLTTTYKGDIKWTVSDDDIISFDEETGQIIGLKPGTATITATADRMEQKCTVHSLYRWPQTWTTATNCSTHLYKAEGSEYVETMTLAKGRSFTVYGDNGTSDGWAYGVTTVNGVNYWGYIPISHVSTKGTISQYRKLGWLWPVATAEGDTKANYISSPYGWRDLGDSSMHKGMDITTGTPSEIKGYEVVSAFEGTVVYISTDRYSGTGYCVAVRSKNTDPISDEYFVAIYMHLNEEPSVMRGQRVLQGTTLGYVGNTGSTSQGYHLHFEANNQNVSIGDGSTARNYYVNLINPLFFFTDYTNNYIIGTAEDKKDNDDKIIINAGSDAVSKYYGAYWYGDDTEER